jgi:hypothetical protein
MASSSPAPTAIPLMPVSEKLARGNHTVWKAQVVAALRGAQLYGFLDGTSIAPAAQIKAKVGSDEYDVPNPCLRGVEGTGATGSQLPVVIRVARHLSPDRRLADGCCCLEAS